MIPVESPQKISGIQATDDVFRVEVFDVQGNLVDAATAITAPELLSPSRWPVTRTILMTSRGLEVDGNSHQCVCVFFWVVVSNIFYFHPYLGKIPILTNIFQMG